MIQQLERFNAAIAADDTESQPAAEDIETQD